MGRKGTELILYKTDSPLWERYINLVIRAKRFFEDLEKGKTSYRVFALCSEIC